MEAETATATKPKRTVSPELKAKMKAGRERAAEERKARFAAELLKPVKLPGPRVVTAKPVLTVPHEFLGITKTDCPIDCAPDKCVITGIAMCGHPCKGAMQPVLMANREVVERYNRARNHLAHVELDRRDKQRL